MIRTLLLATLLSGAASSALAGSALTGLPSRGPVQSGDVVPTNGVGTSTPLQQVTVDAIQAFVRNYPTGITCNGTADDTAAFSAALAAGGTYHLPAGICVISSNLVGAKAVTFIGAGEPDANGVGGTKIKPTSAVTTAFDLDGGSEGSGLYVTAGGFRDLGLDLTNMAGGTTGFRDGHAYDVAYTNVRVLNYTGKTSVQIAQGAYTTVLSNVHGGLVSCVGNGVDNPTTLTLINSDIKGLNAEQCANVTTVGGAIQPLYSTSNTVVHLAPGTRVLGFGEAGSAGLYLSLGSYALNAQFITSIGTDWEAGSQPPATCTVAGWSYGTYDDGINHCAPIIMAVQVGGGVSNVNFINPTFAGMYLYNAGGGGDNLTVTGYQTGGGQGNYHEGAETFDNSIYLNNAQALHGYSDDKTTQTILLDASNGNLGLYGSSAALTVAGPITATALNGTSLSIGPSATGTNFAEIGPFGCFEGSMAPSSSCFMGNGSKFVGLQDPAGTVTDFYLDASNGRITAGSGLCPGAGTDAAPTMTGVDCMVSGNGNPSNSDGRPNGWYYLRGDGLASANTLLFHKESGAWVAVNSAAPTTGATCSGAPTSSFASSNGVVTHC